MRWSWLVLRSWIVTFDAHKLFGEQVAVAERRSLRPTLLGIILPNRGLAIMCLSSSDKSTTDLDSRERQPSLAVSSSSRSRCSLRSRQVIDIDVHQSVHWRRVGVVGGRHGSRSRYAYAVSRSVIRQIGQSTGGVMHSFAAYVRLADPVGIFQTIAPIPLTRPDRSVGRSVVGVCTRLGYSAACTITPLVMLVPRRTAGIYMHAAEDRDALALALMWHRSMWTSKTRRSSIVVLLDCRARRVLLPHPPVDILTDQKSPLSAAVQVLAGWPGCSEQLIRILSADVDRKHCVLYSAWTTVLTACHYSVMRPAKPRCGL